MRLRALFARRSTESAAPDAGDQARRDGFALPLSIMVLALLTMGLVAGFAVNSTEFSTISSQRAQSRAYSFAQMGLEQFLTRRVEVTPDTFCKHCWAMNKSHVASGSAVKPKLDTLPTRKETVTVAFTGGKAVVRAIPVWLDVPNGRGTYYITSTGTDTQSGTGTGAGSTSEASRTVGMFVTWNRTRINVLGALVSFSGIVKKGTGAISGIDQCNSGANVPGITIPTEETVVRTGNASTFVPTGNPPYDTLKTQTQIAAESKLDWAGIKRGDAIQADIIIPGGTFPSTTQFAADTNYWPVIHIKNNAPPLTNVWVLEKGRGMLIVDGDLSINGSDQWDGVILVGGKLTSNGNNVTSGTVMAGLNKLDGGVAEEVEDTQLNGQKSYLYNSCSVAKATSSMARYTLMSNTWMDNVAGY